MYINKEQLSSRLKGQDNLNVRRPHLRKEEGTTNLTHEEKVLYSVLSQTDTQANVAKEFGVSEASVSNAARGLDASKRLDQDLIKDAKAASPSKEEISNKALNVLLTTLGVVESKVKGVRTASEASVVAKNMARVASDLAPPPAPTSPNSGPRILININGPKTKDESEYEILEVPSL